MDSTTQKSIVTSLIICITLVSVSIISYIPVLSADFIAYDDDVYVTENPRVRQGITPENIRWAFTTGYNANWHPLTWLSHMIDIELFGMRPGGHHCTSLFIHCLNGVLLFLLLAQATGARWRSAGVAMLFVLHPLHVESVAWISERKDMLCTLFWLLAMRAYIHYVRRQTIRRYLWIVFFFVLALMSKPMAVTMPFLLLALDYWPLNRFSASGNMTGNLLRLSVEKIPLFCLSIISSWITIVVQHAGGAVSGLAHTPVSLRIMNAIVSYGTYLLKTIVPLKLAVFYPYSQTIPLWKVGVSLVVLGVITFYAIRMRKKRPWVVTGWVWFIGTLVPVIGIVQVGSQSMADRYTYIPLVGLFIIFVWAAYAATRGIRYETGVWCLAGIIVMAVCGMMTFRQAKYWQDTKSLFTHVLSVTDKNHVAHHSLGIALFREGDIQGAREQFKRAVTLKPGHVEAMVYIGIICGMQGDYRAAERYFKKALALEPENEYIHTNLAKLFIAMGKHEKAREHLNRNGSGDKRKN
jgi:hypothetical protein